MLLSGCLLAELQLLSFLFKNASPSRVETIQLDVEQIQAETLDTEGGRCTMCSE